MKKYTLAAIGATAVTFLVCLAAGQYANHLDSFASEVVIPAVCTMLVAFTLTGKISLGFCGLLTLVNLFAFGCYRARVVNVSAWFVLPQSLILQISPVWFAPIAVWGFVKKKPVVWALSALGLVLTTFGMVVIALALAYTPAAMKGLYTVTGGALVLMALLAVYDWVSRKRGNPNKL